MFAATFQTATDILNALRTRIIPAAAAAARDRREIDSQERAFNEKVAQLMATGLSPDDAWLAAGGKISLKKPE